MSEEWGAARASVVKLPVAYRPTHIAEQPVSKCVLASIFGVSTRTVDRWVARDCMPKDTRYQEGCWIQAGAHRRYYVERVRDWLDQR